MTSKEARKLKVGDRVSWTDGANGVIAETSYAGVKIHWDDEQWAILPFNDEKAPWDALSKAVRS